MWRCKKMWWGNNKILLYGWIFKKRNKLHENELHVSKVW